MTKLVWALLAALALGAVAPPLITAQEEIRVLSSTQETDFPREVLFTLVAESRAPIRSIRLLYSFGGEARRHVGLPTFTPGSRVEAQFVLRTSGNFYIPPGADITYFYEIEDEAGNRAATAPQVFTYMDTRFQWRVLSKGMISVYYHDLPERAAQVVLDAISQAAERMGALMGVQLTRPHKALMYNSVREINPALPFRSETTRRELITEGQAYAQHDLVLLLGNQPDVVTHEFTHLLVHKAAESSFGQIPAWVNEGLAVYAQEEPGEYLRALNQGIREDRLLYLGGMDSQPGTPREIILFYGQAYSTVAFLIDTFGEDKLRGFLAALKAGEDSEGALKKVYGLTIDEVEARWRQWAGARPRSGPSPRQREATPQPIPTLVPFGARPQTPPPAATPEAGGSAPSTVPGQCTVLVNAVASGILNADLFLLLLGVVALAVGRRRG